MRTPDQRETTQIETSNMFSRRRFVSCGRLLSWGMFEAFATNESSFLYKRWEDSLLRQTPHCQQVVLGCEGYTDDDRSINGCFSIDHFPRLLISHCLEDDGVAHIWDD